jgi:hypothetical protein
MELVLGQDFAVGFEDVSAKKVQLLPHGILHFRVIVPEAVIPLDEVTRPVVNPPKVIGGDDERLRKRTSLPRRFFRKYF